MDNREEKLQEQLNEESKDLTHLSLITAVANSGTYEGYPISSAYDNDEMYWCSKNNSGNHWIVFDVKKWAWFFAVTDLTYTYHGTLLKSVKFYYNTDTRKFEPIGFDASFFEPVGKIGPTPR